MPSRRTWCRIVLVMVGVLALSGLPQLGPAVIMIGILAASVAVSARLAWVWMRDVQAKTGWGAWSEACRVAAVGVFGVLVLNGLHRLVGSAALHGAGRTRRAPANAACFRRVWSRGPGPDSSAADRGSRDAATAREETIGRPAHADPADPGPVLGMEAQLRRGRPCIEAG
jgi:hypothetical protein